MNFSNSLIMMTTTTNEAVLADGIIPLSTIQRRRNRAVTSGANSIVLNAPGYYKVNASITVTGSEAGIVSVVLQKNNTDVPGITASQTITTADTEVRTLNLSGIVRVYCNEGISTLTLVNTGVAITTENVSLDVEYLG